MKKILIMLLFMFLFTGCEVTYNLEIDGDSYNETSEFLENYNNIQDNAKFSSLYNLYEIYLNKPIPLSKNALLISEGNDKLEDVEYYKTSDLKNETSFGLQFNGNFKNVPFSESNIVSYGVGEEFVNISDNAININVPADMKIFEQYSNLDKITVNIKCKYKVTENNADSVSGNIYTWVITRDNYKDKTIKIKYKTNNKISINLKDPMVRFTIVLSVLVLCGFIIYLFVNSRYKKNNSL